MYISRQAIGYYIKKMKTAMYLAPVNRLVHIKDIIVRVVRVKQVY